MKIKYAKGNPAAAFTMVEIAIALGVIGFALVAIVGILPTGLNVERENREETLVNQDGPYFMEGVRSGAKGLGILTNFVDSITLTETSDTTKRVTIFTNSPNSPVPPGFNGNMINSEWIIGLLSRPKYITPGFTNRIDAHVRAMSGAAINQGTASRDLSFSYSIYSEIVPINFHAFQGNPNNSFTLTNEPFSQKLQDNLYEVRLNFRWPLYASGAVGNGRKIYRSYVSGQIVPTPQADGTILYLFRPQNFAQLK